MYTSADAPTVYRNSLELNRLNFKNRDLVIQPLTEMTKLQLSGVKNNYTPYGGLFSGAKQGGTGRGNGYSPGKESGSNTLKK